MHASPPRVVLASASPRRRALLTLIGVAHDVRPANVDETRRAGEPPTAYAERVARDKAGKVAASDRQAVVIAADTIVVVDGDVLGKPADGAEAEAMLRRLSGRGHTVHTAVAIAYGARLVSGLESVGVTFRALTARDISAYVATGEPMDKAGAYGIQGYGATLVERVDGDYFSVMGLGLRRVVALLEAIGLAYDFQNGVVEP